MLRRGLAAVAALLLVALVAVAGLAPLRARAIALPTVIQAAGFDPPRPLAPPITRREATVGGVVGDLYTPPGPAPAIVLVPGATPSGRSDARVQRTAAALARAGRSVFVPELALYEQSFEVADLDRLVATAAALPDHVGATEAVSFVGFSYGGSFALIAATDPQLEGSLAQVATFGAYFDLVGVVQGVTTGVSLVEGRRIGWQPHPDAVDILRDASLELVPPEEREPLRLALAGDADPAELPPAAQALHAVLTNTDPRRTAALVSTLPPEAQARLARFSPAAVADRLTAPVVAMHSTDDPAVPYGELLRLRAALPAARTVTVGSFRHVDLESEDTSIVSLLGDLWRAWRFTGWVLAAQEGSP